MEGCILRREHNTANVPQYCVRNFTLQGVITVCTACRTLHLYKADIIQISADYFCFNLLSQSVSSIVITYSYGFRKARTPNHDTVKLNTIKNLSKIWNDDEKNDSYNKLISIPALLNK